MEDLKESILIFLLRSTFYEQQILFLPPKHLAMRYNAYVIRNHIVIINGNSHFKLNNALK